MYKPEELGLDESSRYVATARRCREDATNHKAAGDIRAAGRALLAMAWAIEKLGNGIEALEYAAEARDLLRRSDDPKSLGECCHSIGVWRFHNVDGEIPADDFREAAENRLAVGELMAAAQSWHNLGYVQLIAGAGADAETSYDNATELLGRVQVGPDENAASTAFRQLGFVLSHQAFASARRGSVAEALRRTRVYFAHIEKTRAHREPVLAYLAPGIALAHSDRHPEPEGSALRAQTHLPLDAESWLRLAVREAAGAMIANGDTGTGRRAYLGSHMLALAELARWCRWHGRADEADQLTSSALGLARARGWQGEESRLRRLAATAPRDQWS